ncbi:hypothetical protein TorRG33x02_090730 [Trema orientale]|uniref:Uncharacterized protein n=1 Tax=Trema orientale TaxID=63057 RepID=A0A2P5FBK8_TREOI|nr:hypothetical protein TorRG33x02_090730 [Trema orientale]
MALKLKRAWNGAYSWHRCRGEEPRDIAGGRFAMVARVPPSAHEDRGPRV